MSSQVFHSKNAQLEYHNAQRSPAGLNRFALRWDRSHVVSTKACEKRRFRRIQPRPVMRLTKPIYAGKTADLNNEPCGETAISESKRNRKRQAVRYQRFVRLYWRRKGDHLTLGLANQRLLCSTALISKTFRIIGDNPLDT